MRLVIAFPIARPLRIEVKEGWHQVINPGIERRRISKSAADCDRFMKVLADFPSRFDVRVHAYALMPNHYHLLLQTPQANLSQAMQWLNVSHSLWFNRKHGRVGPLFQGRFKAVLIAPDGPLLKVSRYLHLNPVRTRRFGLAKGDAFGEESPFVPKAGPPAP